MPTKIMELTAGLFVALGLAAFALLAMQVSGLSRFGEEPGYQLTARFENIGGLKVRSPVSLAGVRIGRVSAIGVDSQTFQAVVTLTIDAAYANLPKDTSASIFTAGLLGEQYIGLEPGGADEVLGPGDSIKLTQSALVLERLIGQFLFNASGGRDDGAE